MAKSQKSLRVKLGGNWYGAGKDSGLDRCKGQLIEAEIQTGEFGPWIKGWKPAHQAAPQVPPSASSPSSSPAVAAPVYAGAPTVPGDNIQPWFMPFVSNTVAHAIQGGLCQTPEAINQWAMKAAQCAVAIKETVK